MYLKMTNYAVSTYFRSVPSVVFPDLSVALKRAMFVVIIDEDADLEKDRVYTLLKMLEVTTIDSQSLR